MLLKDGTDRLTNKSRLCPLSKIPGENPCVPYHAFGFQSDSWKMTEGAMEHTSPLFFSLKIVKPRLGNGTPSVDGLFSRAETHFPLIGFRFVIRIHEHLGRAQAIF